MTLRTVIVGLGQIGMLCDMDLDADRYVYSHVRAFMSHPGFELVAGIDGDALHRQQFETLVGQPAYSEIGSWLASLAPVVVVIAVPTIHHAAVLQQVLAHCAPRAILCEKPLSYDVDEARDIVAQCEQAGSALYVNYVRRADPAVRRIKQWIETGRIALPVKGIAWYSKGLFNNGSHFADLLQHWLGAAQSFQVVQPGASRGVDPEPDVLLHFAGGSIQMLAADEDNYSYYMIELVSPSGRMRYDLGGERVTWEPAVASAVAAGYTVLDSPPQVIDNELDIIQSHVTQQLHEAMHGRAASICTGVQALQTIEFLHSIKAQL